MYASVRLGVEGVPREVIAAVEGALAPATIALVLALLLPLSVFFAAALLMLSLRARSYKEAMSVISPLMIVVVVPAMIALAPGVRLGPMTALVPILNVSLATREIIAGTAAPLHLTLVFASLVALAATGVVACARWFAREDILFRS
jgi:sodium transport system permease protein